MKRPGTQAVGGHRPGSDLPFFAGLAGLAGIYLVLLVGMLAADVAFTVLPPDAGDVVRRRSALDEESTASVEPSDGTSRPYWQRVVERTADVFVSLDSPNIRYSIKLSLVSCTITTVLSLWVAVPIGYLMARVQFFGKRFLDALLDIPIVLPPLIIGISLLILFQTGGGKLLEAAIDAVLHHLAWATLAGGLAIGGTMGGWVLAAPLLDPRAVPESRTSERGLRAATYLVCGVGAGVLGYALIDRLGAGLVPEGYRFRFTYSVPGVILAQFMVACAFAVRTMMATFEQIDRRREQVALTLGCSRSQAFWLVVLPESRRGMLTAGTLAWARSLGEFGPILIFAGATRLKTEVLPTTVFLEMSVGDIEAAVAVSLLMVGLAIAVLILVRMVGFRAALDRGQEP